MSDQDWFVISRHAVKQAMIVAALLAGLIALALMWIVSGHGP